MPSQLAQAFVTIGGELGPLRRDLATVKTMLGSTLGQVGKISTGILAAAGIQQLVGGVKNLAAGFISTNASLEQYRISLGVMLKDQERANELIREVEQFAAKTPFSTDSLLQSIQLLRAYGFETEKLLPLMQTIGDTAAASPLGMEQGVHRISVALGQIRSKGALATQEMHQLTEAGVGAWEILSNKMGITVAELMSQIEKRQVSSDVAIPALLAGLDERFGGMMDKQSKTLTGLLSTFQDNIAIAMRKIGEPLFGYVKKQMDMLTEWMNTPAFDEFAVKAGNAVKEIVKMIKNFIETMWEMRHVIVETVTVGAKLFVFGKLFGIFKNLTVGIKNLAGAGGLGALKNGLMAVLDPTNILAAGISALALAFANAKLEGISFGESILDLTNKITGYNNAYSDMKEAEQLERDAAKISSDIDEINARVAAKAKKKADAEAEKNKPPPTTAERVAAEDKAAIDKAAAEAASLFYEKGIDEKDIADKKQVLANIDQERAAIQKKIRDMEESIAAEQQTISGKRRIAWRNLGVQPDNPNNLLSSYKLADEDRASKERQLQEELAAIEAERDAAVAKAKAEAERKNRIRRGPAGAFMSDAVTGVMSGVSSVVSGATNAISKLGDAASTAAKKVEEGAKDLKKKLDEAEFNLARDILGKLGVDDKMLADAKKRTNLDQVKENVIAAVAKKTGIDPNILREQLEKVRKPEIVEMDNLYRKVQESLTFKKEDAMETVLKDVATNTGKTKDNTAEIAKNTRNTVARTSR